jgi:F-type H+-transporting ATPase subunit gamma
MPNLIDIRRRIRSVKNTQQITKAMKMVAAAKLRRSQERITATRPYALELKKVVGKLAQASGEGDGALGDGPSHPLLADREETKVLLAIVTGDRGLAGSFNGAVIRSAQEEIGKHEHIDLLLLGKKGAEFFVRRNIPVRAAHRELFSNVAYEDADEIATDLAAAFSSGEYDAVYVIYNRFVSVMNQELTVERLLPIRLDEIEDGGAAGAVGDDAGTDYLLEPSASSILADILPRYVSFQVYRVLLESQAAEHAARMTAMESATKNAGEMIDKLTLTYNRARQAAITTELIEVVSGASALEG